MESVKIPEIRRLRQTKFFQDRRALHGAEVVNRRPIHSRKRHFSRAAPGPGDGRFAQPSHRRGQSHRTRHRLDSV